MTLPEGLKDILRTIIGEALDGVLTTDKDYGTLEYIDYLDYRLHDAEVLDFLNKATRQLTERQPRSWVAVGFDAKYCVTGIPGGMHVAFIPQGEGWLSHNAKHIHLGGGSNAVGFIRPNMEVAKLADQQRGEREARQHRESKADALIERLHQDLHGRIYRRVELSLQLHNVRLLSAKQRAELAAVLGLTEAELDDTAAIRRVLDANHGLNFLCQIMIALDKEALARL